jgi:hypothetical protein
VQGHACLVVLLQRAACADRPHCNRAAINTGLTGRLHHYQQPNLDLQHACKNSIVHQRAVIQLHNMLVTTLLLHNVLLTSL